MRYPMVVCFLAPWFLFGCHKKEPTPSSPSQAAAPAQDPGVTAPEAQPVTPAAPVQTAKPLPPAPPFVTARAENQLRQGVVGQVDAALTQQLQKFIEKEGRFPESFAEFVTTRLDSIPRPPEGKKWVIDTDTIQVKAVSAK